MNAFTTLLITDPAPRVRLVMLNRPDSANALNTQMAGTFSSTSKTSL